MTENTEDRWRSTHRNITNALDFHSETLASRRKDLAHELSRVETLDDAKGLADSAGACYTAALKIHHKAEEHALGIMEAVEAHAKEHSVTLAACLPSGAEHVPTRLRQATAAVTEQSEKLLAVYDVLVESGSDTTEADWLAFARQVDIALDVLAGVLAYDSETLKSLGDLPVPTSRVH